MKVDVEYQLLIQTVVDVDNELLKLVERLEGDQDLEFGDDPTVIREVERGLHKIDQQIKVLSPQFSLSKVPLSKANRYYTATLRINDAIKYIHRVRENSYGSVQNTRQCISFIVACADSVRQMGNINVSPSRYLQ